MPASRSTLSGVYTRTQAEDGEQLYAGRCRACHTQAAHAETFKSAWAGQPLSEPFGYIRDNMPNDAPGSLTPQETTSVLAYFLQLLAMPPGTDSLPADPGALAQIRIDTMTTTSHTAEERKP